MGLRMHNREIGQLQTLFYNFKLLGGRNLVTMKRMKPIQMFYLVQSRHHFFFETFLNIIISNVIIFKIINLKNL